MMHAGVLNPKLKCYPVSKNVDRITLLELIQLLKIYSASYTQPRSQGISLRLGKGENTEGNALGTRLNHTIK
jgi:hypothetical protein